MRKALLSITLIGTLAALFIVSCSKNHYTCRTCGQSLNQLFASLRSTPQGLSVQAGRDTIVYGSKGTMLHFYTNSFKDASGNIITSGTINLQLIEMYKPGDMIANRATTMANGQILQSGGQVTINATMNGQTVYANSYGLGFKHSNQSSAPMALFFGATTNADSTAVWTQTDSTKQGNIANGTTTDTATGGGGTVNTSIFLFDSCTNFTWANCDWFYSNYSPKTSVSVILPDTSFNGTNTQLYLVLPNVNRWGVTTDTFTAVLSNAEPELGGASYNAATHTMKLISESKVDIVPSGLKYELVVIANKNGQYYYWQTSGTVPSGGISVSAAMATATQGDVISLLQGL